MHLVNLTYSGCGNGKDWEKMNSTIPAEAAREAHRKGFLQIAEYADDELDAIYQFDFKTCRYDKTHSNLIYQRKKGITIIEDKLKF